MSNAHFTRSLYSRWSRYTPFDYFPRVPHPRSPMNTTHLIASREPLRSRPRGWLALSTSCRASSRRRLRSHSPAPAQMSVNVWNHSPTGHVNLHHTPARETDEDHERPRWDLSKAPDCVCNWDGQPILRQKAIERMPEALIRLRLLVLLLQVQRRNLCRRHARPV